MTTFIQLHLLTAYAPSNLNRDDSGRPKTARMGGADRLRISSQSLKHAWRTSEMFSSALEGHIGVRTRRIGEEYVYNPLINSGISESLAISIAQGIARQFGVLKADKKKTAVENLAIEQLVHISQHERDLISQLVETLIADKREPNSEELALLRKEQSSADMALFGRMLAASPQFNVEAACQVSHALGVSAVTVEDDFFTAVDDLNKPGDSGSAHMGEQGFASALFYTYICINRDLLLENLGGDEKLVRKTLRALTETALKVAPKGKQNSFASRARASYVLAEMGSEQPCSLAVAFFKPVSGVNQVADAIQALKDQYTRFNQVYQIKPDYREIDTESGKGTINELLDFVSQ